MSEEAMDTAVDLDVQDVQEETPGIEKSLEAAVEGQETEPLTTQEAAAVKKEIERILELKMDGEDRSYKLDDEKDLAEIKRLAQLGGVGQKRMQDAAELRKQVDVLLNDLKSNPRHVLSQFGIDVNKFAEETIQQQIEELQKSPDQILSEEKDKKLADYEKRIAEIERQKEEAQILHFQEAAAQELDKEITNALTSEPDLPKSGYTVKRIADAMLWAMENGYPDVTVKDILPHVKKQINSEIRQLLETLPEEMVEQFIGSNVSDKLRKQRIQKGKVAASAKRVESVGADVKRPDPKKQEKISMREFLYGKK